MLMAHYYAIVVAAVAAAKAMGRVREKEDDDSLKPSLRPGGPLPPCGLAPRAKRTPHVVRVTGYVKPGGATVQAA